jgi:hypothetical protein
LVDVRATKASKMIAVCRDVLGKKPEILLYLDEFKEYYEL